MLRTVVIRNELLKGTLKKAVRLNVARAISVECTRRRHKNNQPSFLKPAQKLQWKPNLLRFYSALPPHLKITLPALSPTMESGTIISWEKKEGDKLNEGDLLAEIETDKATMGFETPEEGYLAKIIIAGGTKNVPIGKLVCIIVQNEAEVAAFKKFKDDGSAVVPSAPPPAAAAPPPPAAAAPSVPSATPNVEHIKVFLPALSPTMEVGTIISWEKKEGDKLKEGDLLAEIETDKASMGFETPEEGYLAKILIPGGSKNVPIGKLVCIIVPNQADVAAFKNFKDVGVAPAPSIAAASASKTPSSTPPAVPMSTPPPVSSGGRVYASPMAQRLAEKRQIRLQGKGTGLFDSITSKDLPPVGAAPKPTAGAPKPAMGAPAAVSAPASRAPSKSGVASPYTDTPITSIRKVIAQRLTQSKQLVPHYYMTDEIIVDKLMATRSRLNQILDHDGVKLSINDFIIKALSLAVLKVPCTNSSWMDNTIRQYTNVDVSVAVTTEKGLITPIVFQADLKGLATISKNVKDLANKARQSKLQPQEYQGGTITVSNLGMYAVNHFTAIINPPQSCILAVGTMQKKLIIDSQDERGFKEITYIAVTLSCDHRTVDGAESAKMLQHFRKYLEEPESMLL